MAKGGLFAIAAPPPDESEEDVDDYSGDALPADEDAPDPELGAGPFEAYCQTAFDTEAPYEARCDALRQAILTILEERGD